MIDEKKLLEGLRRKENKSIEKAIEIYTPYVSTVIFNMAGTRLNKEDLEEVIADTFITLWKNADNIDMEKGTIRSYIAAVARNGVLRKINKSFTYECIEDKVIADDKNTLDDKIMSEFLWKAVMELGEPDSEIFVRFYKYGEKLGYIASVTGLKLSTVKTKLSRGKVRLRKILGCEEESL